MLQNLKNNSGISQNDDFLSLEWSFFLAKITWRSTLFQGTRFSLSGWWLYTHPSKKYEVVNWDDDSNPIYGKIKNGNQTTNQLFFRFCSFFFPVFVWFCLFLFDFVRSFFPFLLVFVRICQMLDSIYKVIHPIIYSFPNIWTHMAATIRCQLIADSMATGLHRMMGVLMGTGKSSMDFDAGILREHLDRYSQVSEILIKWILGHRP